MEAQIEQIVDHIILLLHFPFFKLIFCKDTPEIIRRIVDILGSGLRPALVVSSPKMAKETLKNHDIEFSGRPSMLSQNKLFYNGLEIVFSPYNDYWREIRKLCVVHIFSVKRVASFSSIRKYEVSQMIRKISGHAASSKATNLNEILMSLTSTIICRVAFGRRYDEEGNERSR
ncbi:Cytochrome P450 83B1 [Senna tora]|uniref:Cytochrome P450 83B1 n=1 Tax=Senna tora TaxID=362788 RepID=A0A834WN25_9FABA|nr:Cytochrome P450 83B1 [Senna tora]